jgi:hypothetical protein
VPVGLRLSYCSQMAASRPQEILFVFHGQNQSKRHQELQDARRRAHAARQSARKNRELTTPIIRRPIPPADTEHDSDEGIEEYVLRRLPTRGPVRRFPSLPSIGMWYEQAESGPPVLADISPLSILSQDRSDPFKTTVVSTLPTVLQRYLHDGEYAPWLPTSH